MNDYLQQGISALKAGDRASARRLLVAAIRQSPDNVQAWLWLSGAVDHTNERIDCLNQVLRFDPENEIALRGLALIQKSTTPPGRADSDETGPDAHDTKIISDTNLENQELIPFSSTQRDDIFQEPIKDMDFRREMPIHPNIVYMKKISNDQDGEVIFRTRPSIAPTLIGFWCMFFIVLAMNSLIQEGPQAELSLSFMTCGILGAVVIYILVIRLSTKYEVTNRNIYLVTQGKRIVVPISHILDVVHKQTRFQKLIGLGDILIEASIDGILRQLRMYNLADSERRKEQITSLIK